MTYINSVIADLFVKKQYVRNGLLLKFSKEEMKEWERNLQQNCLTTKEYESLLNLPHWELGFIPFILSGLRIFNISSGHGIESDEPPSAKYVTPVFHKIWKAIREGGVVIEKCDLFISIRLGKALIQPASAVFEEIERDFFNNTNKYPILIKPSRVIEWAILNDIQLSEALLCLLNFYQEKPKEIVREELINSHLYKLKIIKEPKNITIPEEQEISYLAAAQILWSINQDASKSEISKHELLKQFGPQGGYSKDSKHPLKLLSLIDPVGTQRPKGGLKNSKVVFREKRLPREIPGLFVIENQLRKINLKTSKIAFQSHVKMLELQNYKIGTIEEIFSNSIIRKSFEGLHPVFQEILNDWHARILEDPIFKKFPHIRNKHFM